ncbi:MAG: N(G),N(G)-dimethylarginine dimethylaminohydrolase [Desulfobacterales bacterium]|nr:MAG: N(G),N(G)-dimethylarginine dimethylaminohydrolase [Desulfobacterales bacterium]
MFTHAITRRPGKNFAEGLTTAGLGTPRYELITKQHEAYVQTLKSLDLQVIELETLADFPDAYFVEDVAVVTGPIAVITNPGAATRQGEQKAMEPVLAPYRATAHIRPPGTVDGGDVLMVGNHFFIGISPRTNPKGAEQLGRILENCGYTWTLVAVRGGLHLKSHVNYAGQDTLLVTEPFAARDEFKGYAKIIVDKEEEYAANSLWINDHMLIPQGFPRLREKLETLGIEIRALDMSEVRKMDGGLTCLSLRF